jgi:hypothetical protein
MPNEQAWIDKAKELLDAERAKDKKVLEAAAARTETRNAARAKIEKMLVDTGRATDPANKADSEALRAAREETFLHRTSERIEQASNVTFIAEDMADIVADGNVRPPPAKPGILNVYATATAAPVSQQATWVAKNQEYNDAMNEYNAAQVNRNTLQVKIGNALTDVKAKDPDRVKKVKEEINRKNAELGKPALGTAQLDAAADQQIKRVLVFNEIDSEIRTAVETYDTGHKNVDPETRLDEVAKIVEKIGTKYGYTNLAHFISRHGAPRTNPDTGTSKRTSDDFVSRMATGVGPDRKHENFPADTVTAPRADATNVTVPKYANVGYETASAASQHASAKAALFMIDEAMAEAALVDELTGKKSSKMDVVVGKEDIGGQKLGSYEEPGKLGSVYELQGTPGVPKLTSGQRGKPLVEAEIGQRIGDTKVTPDQPSAKVTLLAAKMLGGYNVMTMMSQAQQASEIKYTQGGTETTLQKTSTNVDLQRTAAMIRVRGELLQDKTDAEGELTTAKINADAKAKDATDASAALDTAIGKLDATKQQAAKDLKKLVLDEVAAAQALEEAKDTAKGLEEEAARLKKRIEAAEKELETKKNAIAAAATPIQREDAEYEHTVAKMAFEELKTDAEQLAKLVAAETKRRDARQVDFNKAELTRKEAESKAGLSPTELGELKNLLTDLEKKQKAAAEAGEARDTAAKVVKFYAERHADADRQVNIAQLGIAEVLRRELEKEGNESKTALAFDSTKESPSDYETRLKSFEDGQRSQIEEQRKRLQADMAARAAHGKEVRDDLNPAQAALAQGPGDPSVADSGDDSDMAGLAARIDRIRKLIDNWQSKADGLALERDKNAKEQVALQTEYRALKEKKGEDHSKRLGEIEKEIESLRAQAGGHSLKQNTALNNVAQLAKKMKELSDQWQDKRKAVLKDAADKEKAKPSKLQQSNAKADAVAKSVDDLRLAGGLATINRAEAELELRLAEAKVNVPGASEMVKLRKDAAALKKTLMEAKAVSAAAQIAEQEAKARYEKLKAVEDRLDKLVADTTLPATEPRVVDLKARVASTKVEWDNAKIAVANAENDVKAATTPYEAKAKEVAEKAKAATT